MRSIKHFAITLLALAFATLAVPAARAEPYRVVALGDSLTAGYGLQPGESFPEKLQAALKAKGHDVEIVNAGVSGDTSSGGLARLDWSVPDGTQLVIVELGANDMLRGINPTVTERNLDEIASRLKGRGIAMMIAGMRAAPNLGPDYQKAFDGIFPRLSEKYGAALYPFFLDGVAADRAFLLEDGMHPNAEGVDRMVDRFLPVMEAAMAAKPPT